MTDWDRYLVDAARSGPPLGDPTRWGAQTTQRTQLIPIDDQLLQSEQVIQVACSDRYARNWTLAGTIDAPEAFWATPPAAGPVTYVGGWEAFLRVTPGEGQVSITQVVKLRPLIELQSEFYADSNAVTGVGAGGRITRTFHMPMFVCANNFGVQVVHFFNYNAPPAAPELLITSLIIAPIAADLPPMAAPPTVNK